ncbi:MliC family protein [Rhodoferax sp. 4810]|nr:MliC family protein [Rhodoferax jenense]
MNKAFFLTCSALVALCLSSTAQAASPGFDCAKARSPSTEASICADAELAKLDRQMTQVYAAALKKARQQRPPVLKAEQRGWIKGRNDCWKSADQRQCIADSYRLRIAELQARYRLVTPTATVRYACDGNPANEVVATFFHTDPATLMAERGDAVSFMVQQPSASGARYQGRNEWLWEHQGEATIVWGYEAPEMRCQPTATPVAVTAPMATLAGTRWQLLAFQSMDDAQGTTRVADPARYTVTLGTDGRAAFRLDCNRGASSWQADASNNGSGTLRFGAIAMTRAMCGPGSLDGQLARHLPYVRSFVLKDGHLFMALLADGGIYEWAPVR